MANEPSIELKPVQSSNIKAIGYDAISRTLAVQFANATYHYLAVDAELYDAFLCADSKGKFFQQHILRHFETVKQTSLAKELDSMVETVGVDGSK